MTAKLQQGDSYRIAIILPIDRMDKVQDLNVQISSLIFSLSNEKIITTEDENVFLVNITSAQTQKFNSLEEVSISIDYSDLGVKKTAKAQNLVLQVERNTNIFNNISISELTNATVTVAIVEQTIDVSIQLANYLKGEKGDTGATGAQGIQGEKGTQGEQGIQGVQGIQGIQGEQGVQGVKGDTGEKGEKGDKGDKGDAGVGIQLKGSVDLIAQLPSSGIAGDAWIVQEDGDLYAWNTLTTSWNSVGQIVGPQGEKGDKGDKGDVGEQGIQGIQGIQGEQGVQGLQGIQGLQGVQGVKGEDGKNALILTDVTNSAILTGTNSQTILKTMFIPANTFKVGDVITVKARMRRLATPTAQSFLRLSIGTNPNQPPTSQVGTMSLGSATTHANNSTFVQMKRELVIKSTTETELSNVGSLGVTDEVSLSVPATVHNIDWAVDQYFYFGAKNGNTTDSTWISFAKVSL
jgi:hypothetical protein